MQSTFSPSSLACFENCPKQYHFRYVEPIEVEQEGIEAFVGKRVHEVLERLYRFVADGRVPSLARVIWRYHQNFEAQFDAGRVRVVREGTDPAWYRAAGARGLENYYRRHYPFDGDETLGLERAIRFDLQRDGRYALRGVIDRLVRAKDGALEIHDFKTGRRVPSQVELDRDRQLGLTIDRIRSETEWAPRPSGLCDWCEFRPHCPAFGGSARPAAGAAPAPPEARVPLGVG